ncbi:MAG: hypothetical protein RL196_1559 [Actinomycetota bacterium]|jgi:hypothetical protein
MLRLWPRFFVTLGLASLLALHLYLGTENTANSAYSTLAGVFGEYMNGLIRLVFPFIVTLLAAMPLRNQTSENFIHQTRGRTSLARHLLGLVKDGVAANAIYFTVFGLATTAAATFVVPALNPEVLQPTSYGLTAENALKLIAQQNPLGFAAAFGGIAFGIASTAWMVCSSTVFSLLAFACVLVTRRRAAILIPLGIYIGESVITQVLNAPKLSFLLLMPTPSSMGSFDFVTAALPGFVASILSCATIWLVIRYAPKYGWFA